MKQLPEDKIKPENGAGLIKTRHAQISFIADVIVEDLVISANLPGEIAHRVARAGRNAVHDGEFQLFLHNDVQHAARVRAARAAALQHKTD